MQPYFLTNRTVSCAVSLRSYSYENKPTGDRYGFIQVNGKDVVRADFKGDGTDYKRGVNLVVLDPRTCLAGVPQSFDTYGSAAKTTDLLNFLKGLSTGSILLGVTFDDPFQNLGAALIPLKLLGVDVASVGFRGMFAFALQIGNPARTILEKSASRASPLTLSVQLSGEISGILVVVHNKHIMIFLNLKLQTLEYFSIIVKFE